MNYPFEFPAGIDRAEVIRAHRLRDTCMHCGFEPPAEECREFRHDTMKDMRRSALISAVDARRGTDALVGDERFSSGFIVEQAAHRYFMLLDEAQAALKGRFTQADFQVILNVECQPTWDWDPAMSVAQMVADDNVVRRLKALPEGDHMRQLLEKLLTLSPLENAALVDACERVWRGYDNPLL
jgi:hypothetical protein